MDQIRDNAIASGFAFNLRKGVVADVADQGFNRAAARDLQAGFAQLPGHGVAEVLLMPFGIGLAEYFASSVEVPTADKRVGLLQQQVALGLRLGPVRQVKATQKLLGFFQRSACQTVFGHVPRTRRVVVAQQPAAAVVPGALRVGLRITETLDHMATVFSHADRAHRVVISGLPMTLAGVPHLQRLPGFTRQADPPPRIAAVSGQHLTGQAVHGQQISRGRSVRENTRVALCHQPPHGVEHTLRHPLLGCLPAH